MDTNQLIDFINRCGFPIFVAAVLLLRVDRMHVENIHALEKLTEAIRELRSCIELKHPE